MDEFKEILKSITLVEFTNNQDFATSQPQLKPICIPTLQAHYAFTPLIKAICLPDNGPKGFNSTFLNNQYRQINGIRIKFPKYQSLGVYTPFVFKRSSLTAKAIDYSFCNSNRKPLEGNLRPYRKAEWQLVDFEESFNTNIKPVMHLQLPMIQKIDFWRKSELKMINEWGLCGLDCSNQEGIIISCGKNFNSCFLRMINFNANLEISTEFVSKPSKTKCVVNSAALKDLSLIEAILAKDWVVEEAREQIMGKTSGELTDKLNQSIQIQIEIENCLVYVIKPDQVDAIREVPHNFLIIETE